MPRVGGTLTPFSPRCHSHSCMCRPGQGCRADVQSSPRSTRGRLEGPQWRSTRLTPVRWPAQRSGSCLGLILLIGALVRRATQRGRGKGMAKVASPSREQRLLRMSCQIGTRQNCRGGGRKRKMGRLGYYIIGLADPSHRVARIIAYISLLYYRSSNQDSSRPASVVPCCTSG